MPTALLILTSHGTLGDTGKPTGWFVPEAAHPWQVFTDAGWQVAFASTAGGHAPSYGADASDPVQQRFLAAFGEDGPLTQPVAEVDPEAYVAVLYVGGHGTMWDFPRVPAVSDVGRRMWERGGVVAAVCHGPAALAELRLSDGSYLVAGRRVAAFTDAEESAVGLAEVVPFLLASRLAERGAIHVPAGEWQPNVVVDGRLVTGQNPASAAGVARAVIVAVSG